MKKLILLFLVLILKFAPAKAQWVTIPDANFVIKLTQLFPSCMNGNQMDTTCSQIVISETVDIQSSNISNLFGIQYFDNLTILDCSYNQLTSLPTLPNSLMQLSCYSNQLTILPAMPNSLISLGCGANPLASLPTLPNSLMQLYCDDNQLSGLPALPNSLISLECNNNQMTSLPTLPNSLASLSCGNNPLTSLPTLPNSLTYLGCVNNQLTSLPTLPNSLTNLECRVNQLTSLPTLPDSLIQLNCSENQLTILPLLPNPLIYLYCDNNQLITLPLLPNSLIYLYCNNNQLTSLPTLPNSLGTLWCNNNQLTSLPEVPVVMSRFIIQDNNISCLVNLPLVTNSIFANISNNPLTCVPNQTNYSLGLPLCIDGDPINNPNNCPSVNITGAVYSDINGNCSYNSVDLNSQNIPIKLYDNQNNFLAQSYTNNGVYSFSTLLPDTFQVKIDTTNLPVAMSCGQNSAQSLILNSSNQTIQNINFPIVCDAEYDAFVQSVSRSGWVFPGQIHTLRTNITDNETWFNLDCDNTTTSGTVIIQVNGPVSFVAPAAGALIPTVNGYTFTYNVSNLNDLNATSFGLSFMTDTTAQANDQICVHVEISLNPIDADTTNNVYDFCYNVVNSYDPNMKEVYPVNVLPGYEDWFTYTIHFQNTGNAPAFNIRLRDTLDTQLDLNTFEVLGYSHPATVTVSGNILTVRFNNIMLPDSTSDYEGSIGYYQYRIKPTPNLPNGSQISNTAYIYFDYNAPIITNTTQNNFDITVSSNKLTSNPESFEIYPNPSTGIFTFKDAKNIQRVEVYNVMGQEIAVFVGDNTNKVSKQINLSNYSKGIYFAKINGSVVIKLVKE